jgi:hypothetical protein
MGTRRLLVSLGVVVALAASFALLTGTAHASFCSPSVCGGGGPAICAGNGYAADTTWTVDETPMTACYSYGVGFYAYTPGTTGCITTAFGTEDYVFYGHSQTPTLYDHQWCPDGTWHYYFYNKGTSDVLLSTEMQIFPPNTEYIIEQFHT